METNSKITILIETDCIPKGKSLCFVGINCRGYSKRSGALLYTREDFQEVEKKTWLQVFELDPFLFTVLIVGFGKFLGEVRMLVSHFYNFNCLL